MKKRTKILLISLGCVLCALLIVILVFTQTKALGAGEVSEDGNYAHVMANIGGMSEANPRVVDLAMLGAHDATTYSLEKYGGVSGDVDPAMRTLYKCAWGLSYRYTKTQVSTVSEQFAQGVRLFHFKCTYGDGAWYGCHSLIDGPLSLYIEEILQCLETYPEEIAVLECQLMYAGERTLSGFYSDLFSIAWNGKTLLDFIPYENIELGELTYNDVTVNGTKGGAVVVPVLDKGTSSDEFFDEVKSAYRGKCYARKHGGNFASAWYNRMDSEAVAEGIDASSVKIRENFEKYSGGFRVMQIETTPTSEDLLQTAAAWSLVHKARAHNLAILHNPNFGKWLEVMPVVVCDFATSASGGFNTAINEKLIAYNRALVERLK